MVKKRKTPAKTAADLDGVYVLKLVLYVLLGSLWLKVDHGSTGLSVSLPVGLAVGLIFASHEHFRIDRKVEYAALIVAALLGLIAPYGLFVSM